MILWEWLKKSFGVNLLVFFVLVYCVAWVSNALLSTKFILKEWEELGKYILGKYGADSLLNTPIPWTQKKEG